jgi:hypothetical protein
MPGCLPRSRPRSLNRRCWISALFGLSEILGTARMRRSARRTGSGCTPCIQDCMGFGRVGVLLAHQVSPVVVGSTESLAATWYLARDGRLHMHHPVGPQVFCRAEGTIAYTTPMVERHLGVGPDVSPGKRQSGVYNSIVWRSYFRPTALTSFFPHSKQLKTPVWLVSVPTCCAPPPSRACPPSCIAGSGTGSSGSVEVKAVSAALLPSAIRSRSCPTGAKTRGGGASV